MQAVKGTPEERVTLATQFSETIHMLLAVVPLSSILAVSDTVMADLDEEEANAQPSTSTSGVFPSLCITCDRSVGLSA